MLLPRAIVELYRCVRLALRFGSYKPQPVTLLRALRWLKQFRTSEDRKLVLDYLEHVRFVKEHELQNSLLHLNRILIERLARDGIDAKSIIYVQVHEAGSSSPVILNMLRNLGGLEQRGCIFLDGKNVRELHEITTKLGEGAIIYVDDFVGTGDQFLESRDFVKDFIIGNFPEFLLAACICEEGYGQVTKQGVEPLTDILHGKASRPLHEHSSAISRPARQRLIQLAQELTCGDYYDGLGYKRFCTSVVLYLNAADTTPRLLRGVSGQSSFKGILPRYQDLKIEPYEPEPKLGS